MLVPPLNSSCSRLMEWMYYSYIPRIVNAAISVGLFEALKEQSMGAAELAGLVKTHEGVTEALLEVLAELELVTRSDTGYRQSAVSHDFLRQSSPGNQLKAIGSYSGGAGGFDNLEKILKDGPEDFNSKMWCNRDMALDMAQHARGGSLQSVLSFTREIPAFSEFRKMGDIAGSIGYYSSAFVEANPDLEAHVFDMSEVCAIGRDLEDHGYRRIQYHAMDIHPECSFGEGFDFMFSSHFLYRFHAQGVLEDFMGTVNRSMTTRGVFLSQHTPAPADGRNNLMISIVELMTRCTGYETFMLPERDLTEALEQSGFGEIRTRYVDSVTAYPVLLLAAVKTKDV